MTKENNDGSRLSYLPQLDSFRFFAVFLVIVSHWLPGNKVNNIPNGFLGVTFFFVLSGFLISTNLLLTKQKITSKKTTVSRSLLIFYIRRTLRIFPLYFLVILAVYYLASAVYENHFSWFALYIPNFLIYKQQTWPGMLSHFWSLGVEEQFYLVWPFLIFCTPQKWLKQLFYSIIILSILFKFTRYSATAPFFNFYDVLPLSCFDAFGIGALLAHYKIFGNSYLEKCINALPFYILLAGSIIINYLIYIIGFNFLFGLTVSISSALMIIKVFKGYKGRVNLLLDNKFIQYLGKISYGLYVYHNFIPWLIRCIKGIETRYPIGLIQIHANWLNNPIVLLILQFLLLLLISTISWFLFEKPINNLKKYLH